MTTVKLSSGDLRELRVTEPLTIAAIESRGCYRVVARRTAIVGFDVEHSLFRKSNEVGLCSFCDAGRRIRDSIGSRFSNDDFQANTKSRLEFNVKFRKNAASIVVSAKGTSARFRAVWKGNRLRSPEQCDPAAGHDRHSSAAPREIRPWCRLTLDCYSA
jgi:hypothetical protein